MWMSQKLSSDPLPTTLICQWYPLFWKNRWFFFLICLEVHD
jgi:hypothetical protein